ncbi:leucine-rich PPR motif-containing protein, mitochondrial [Hyalella azteca]|uniref:Leucine-rich PPR motif-containing protein, mitochondrial n=1 Tax=Hyalella azteca TaxID=294128 RepID=A0A8B7N721_HYAAZ|nr:leucine-rich PPR motif-containing protein, mitochondrial [Hyalella azteca]
MSSMLRSVRNIPALKALAEASSYYGTIRPQEILHLRNNLNLFCSRFISAQQKFETRSEKDNHSYELSNLLERLNTEGRMFGRISNKLVQDAISLLRKPESVSSSQSLVVLRCCGALMPEELPDYRTKLAQNVWQILEKRGVPMDLSHYNALLRVYIENEYDFSPAAFLENLESKGIEPNRVTYQRLITRNAQLGDIEGATKILEKMKEKNLSINESIFNSLILGHSRAGDTKSAEDMLQVMQSSGLEPSVDTYLALAISQAEHGDIEGVKATISQSAGQEQALHDRDIMEVIYALASKGHAEHVPEMISLLRKEWGYNQDCKNLIFRLLNAGCDDSARLVYDTMDSLADPESQSNLNQGLFYVKHLIIRDKPISSILSMCEDVSGSNPHLLQRSLEAALARNTKLVYPIMDAIQAKGADLRPHFFWPLIAQLSARGDVNGIYDVLGNMKSRGVPVSMSTMLDYVLPTLFKDPEVQVAAVMNKLEQAGIYYSESVNAISAYLVKQGDLAATVDLLKRFRFRLVPLLRRDLAVAVARTRDYTNVAAIMGQVRAGAPSDRDHEEEEESLPLPDGEEMEEDIKNPAAPDSKDDVVGQFLVDVTYRVGSDAADFDWVALLTALKDRGLSISKDREATVSHRLGSKATSEVNSLLSTLASGSLTRVDLDRTSSYQSQTSYNRMPVKQLEAALEQCTSNGGDPKNILIKLLAAYARTGDVEKAEETFKVLQETHQFPIGVGLRLLMINMYCNAQKLQPAEEILASIRATDPDAVFNSPMLLKLAILYVNEGKIDEAVSFLETEGKRKLAAKDEAGHDEPESLNKDQFIEVMCSRLLSPLADRGDVDAVMRLERAILDNRIALPTRRLLGAGVKAYIVKGDIESAMACIVDCKKNYNVLPFKSGLTKELIKREDTQRLQQLVDMTTDLYGEYNSLLDLTIGFVDEGRVKEAKRVLETPGLRIPNERLVHLCELYARENKTKCLEDLLAATADVSSVDRRPIFHHLLKSIIKDGNCDKALALWTQMQDEDVFISDQFLHDLGTFLQENGKTVPFAIPDLSGRTEAPTPRIVLQPQVKKEQAAPRIEATSAQKDDPRLLEYRKRLQDNELDEAVTLFNELSKKSESLYNRDRLDLIQKLFEADRFSEAVQIIKLSPKFRGQSFVKFVTLRRVLQMLADKGDYDTIDYFVDTSRPKEQGSIVRQLCVAAGRSNNADRCFTKFNIRFDQATTPEELNLVSMQFSKAGFLWLLNNDSSLLPKMEILAEKLKSRDVMDGVSILWAYHFIKADKKKLSELNEVMRSKKTVLPHSAVCDYVRDTRDVAVAERFLATLEANPEMSTPTIKLATHCALMDLHCHKNSLKEAMQHLEEALKLTNLESIPRTSLEIIKGLHAAHDLPFPYTIPTRQRTKSQV